MAENFNDVDLNSIVAVKDAKVDVFIEKKLSVSNEALYKVDPDIDETNQLKLWYDTVGASITDNLVLDSNRSKKTAGGIHPNDKTPVETLADLIKKCADEDDKYYIIKGMYVGLRFE